MHAKDKPALWEVVYKAECFGKVTVTALDRITALEAFAKLPVNRLILGSAVKRVNVAGSYKRKKTGKS